MPLSSTANLAQRLYMVTLELAQGVQDPEDLRSLIDTRSAILDELEGQRLDARTRQILVRVQEAEARALTTLQDWRSVIASEANVASRRRVAVKSYSNAA